MKRIEDCKLKIVNCKLSDGGRHRSADGGDPCVVGHDSARMKRIENCKLQIENCKLSDEGHPRQPNHSARPHPPQFSIFYSQFSIFNPPLRKAFTLIELLVVIIIITLLAGVLLGALAKTREAARVAATKATIAKLNELVMRKYESYMFRRAPIQMVDSTTKKPLSAKQAAQVRLYAIRDLMRMEMPERFMDINDPPMKLPLVDKALSSPALQRIYQAKIGTKSPGDHAGAKCLYLWVMTSIPEAKTMFSGSEIADVDGDGMKSFIDGWGRPICFLRWAPGFSPNSDIQIADPVNRHDPFDPGNFDDDAYQLFPLIYAGVIGKDPNGFDDYGGIQAGPAGQFADTYLPFKDRADVGKIPPQKKPPLFTNHHMDQR